MKFIRCEDCDDIVVLRPWKKSCKCGKVSGRYVTSSIAEVSKGATVLGVHNDSFFVIHQGNKHVRWLDK